MFRAYRALKKLTPSQRDAIAHKRISGTFTPATLLADLRALSHFDASNDSWRSTTKKLLIGLSVASFMTLFLTIASGLQALLGLLALFVVLITFFGISRYKYGRLDISNNVRQVALPFLAILKHDMRADELVQVTLDFREPTHKEKELHVAPSYSRGAYHSVVDTTYRDIWFEGSARLADGAQLRWRVLEDIRQSYRTKRNARGKTKTKTRYYKRSYIEVVVSLPVKQYALRQVRADTQLKASLHAGEKRNTVRLSRKLKTKALDPIPVRLLLDAISAVYTSAEPPTRRAG